MRTLKYAILGMLVRQNMTGYELMQQFESALCEFWNAKHSQIYPELKKLTNEGMIEYQVEITGTVLEKKVYSITEEGREDFQKWLETDEDMVETPKDIFRLRMFFSARMDAKKRIDLLESQLLQHKNRLIQLKKNGEKFGDELDKESDEFGDYIVLLGAVMREEQTCAWLEKCIGLCIE